MFALSEINNLSAGDKSTFEFLTNLKHVKYFKYICL